MIFFVFASFPLFFSSSSSLHLLLIIAILLLLVLFSISTKSPSSPLFLILLFSTITPVFLRVYAFLFEYSGEEHTYFIDWFWFWSLGNARDRFHRRLLFLLCSDYFAFCGAFVLSDLELVICLFSILGYVLELLGSTMPQG